MSALSFVVRPSRGLRIEAALTGALALAVALAILAFGPAPGDAPARLYRTLLVDRGDLVWDNLWFGGVYPLADYSLLYYFPAALVGNIALALTSAALSAWLFARICLDRWGARAVWPTRLAGVLCAAPAFTARATRSIRAGGTSRPARGPRNVSTIAVMRRMVRRASNSQRVSRCSLTAPETSDRLGPEYHWGGFPGCHRAEGDVEGAVVAADHESEA